MPREFKDLDGERQVVILLRDGERQVTVEYPLSLRTDRIDRYQERRIFIDMFPGRPANTAIPPVNERKLVRIASDLRSHGFLKQFTLFQYNGTDAGNAYRTVLGPRLRRSENEYGVSGIWVDHNRYNNIVVLVPKRSTKQQVFSFVAQIYDPPTTAAMDLKHYETVRFTARRVNHVPTWDKQSLTKQSMTVQAGTVHEFSLDALDVDGDLITFRLDAGSVKGVLRHRTTRFSKSKTRKVNTGSQMAAPIGSLDTQTVTMEYQAKPRRGWAYPVTDTFTVSAGDGSGAYSPPRQFTVTITAPEVPLKNWNKHTKTIIILAGVFVAMMLAVTATICMIRKKQREAYMRLPPKQQTGLG
jgi:hypothetical protein